MFRLFIQKILCFVLGARDTGVNITEAQHLDAYISSGKDNFFKKVNKIIAGSDVLRKQKSGQERTF